MQLSAENILYRRWHQRRSYGVWRSAQPKMKAMAGWKAWHSVPPAALSMKAMACNQPGEKPGEKQWLNMKKRK
jgi:hypothetical protein